jgi:cytochrome c
MAAGLRSRIGRGCGASALLLAVASLACAQAPCDATMGAEVYVTKCGACHTVLSGQNGAVGPSLYGIVGRRPASVAAFSYSPSMTDRRELWTPATLDWFLVDPPNRVPGTYMAFSGLKNDPARAAVICYLATLGPAAS